ncbi:MAG: toll/interleukin-1 receptor domain-containing protein [Gammaproteobacteria bacterium]|nr:toll/interleukin-1 receptor domain-containing protein [Gammaproteobacteria bacterium]
MNGNGSGSTGRFSLPRPGALLDLFFGYDFFISYAHDDGGGYPEALREQLIALGFKVFLDRHEYTAGEALHAATRRRIAMSRKLIVVVRPAALNSEWVAREVEVSLAAGKTPLAIDINDTLAQSPPQQPLAKLLQERIYISEFKEEPDGPPQDATLQALVRSFTATRLETLRLRGAAFGALLFAVLFISASGLYLVAEQRAAQIERTCITIVSELERGWSLIDSFRTTQFGKLIAAVTEDLANLPRPSRFDCSDPS